jgi:hypothetical protein
MSRMEMIRAGAIVTDGPVASDFMKGWAVHPFKGNKANYWEADRSRNLGQHGAYGLI